MHIGLGQSVLSSDGERIGSIDRIVLDHHGLRVEQFVIHKGIFLDQDKIVPRSAIGEIDRDGVHLTLDASDAKQLARFEYSYAVTDLDSGYPEVIPGPLQSMILFSKPPEGKTYQDHGSYFQLDSLAGSEDAPPSGLTENGIIIGKSAEIVGSDGQLIGHVHEIEFEPDGSLIEIVVQTGLLRHHLLTILVSEMAQIGDEEIVLTVPAASVASRAS